jgi:hypothetical protein
MGEWKTALSIRVRRSLKDDLQKIADREYRKLGNLGELLMEWSYEQLVAAGSTEKLLKYKMPVPNRSRRDSRRPPMNPATLERIEDTHRD